jgi:DNA replication protein DnaC
MPETDIQDILQQLEIFRTALENGSGEISLPEAAETRELDEKKAKDIERSQTCSLHCPGVSDCPFGNLIHTPLKGPGRVLVRTHYCAEYDKWKKWDERQKHITRLIPSSQRGIRLQNMNFEGFLTSNTHKSAALAKEIALQTCENGGTLVLSGETGVGKTHLAAALANRLLSQNKNVVFVSFNALLQDIKNSFSNGENVSEIWEILRTVDSLILDDVGQEIKTEYSYACLYDIVNDRYNARAQLVITTNHPTHEDFAKANERGVYIVRRLREMGHWMRIEAGTYRRE